MSYPLFRFTANNSVKGLKDITESTFGWKDIAFALERDKEFHSLVELVETPLIFREESKDYILSVINDLGVDVDVDFIIDLSYNEGVTYDQVFEGLIRLVDHEKIYEGDYVKEIKIPIIQNDFWQTFMNRRETQVKVGDTIDLDGGTRETINPYTLNLPSQIINKQFISKNLLIENVTFDYGADGLHSTYFLGGYNTIEINELDKSFIYPQQITPNSPITDLKYKLTAEEEGSYSISVVSNFDYQIQIRDLGGAIGNYSVALNIVREKKDSTFETRAAILDSGTSTFVTRNSSISATTVETFTDVKIGENIYIHYIISADNVSYLDWLNSGTSPQPENSISITASTTFADSTTDAFMIHDAGNSICDLITGKDGAFYSDFYGHLTSQIQSYASNGGGSHKAITGGINTRGKLFTEKPLYISFMDWWDGLNPLENLGLGYELDQSSPQKPVIRVEEKEHFYQNIPSLTLSNIEDLVETEVDELYIKSVETGFQKWKSEEIGALDDPQTKHQYAEQFKTFGKDLKLLSKFYGASTGMEVTRRKDIKKTEDWRLDDEIFLYALGQGLGGWAYPELDENFTTITNLLNSDTRYNTRYTPKRSLLRWGNWLSAGLTKYPGSTFKFVGGEGNYDMTSQIPNADRGDFNNNVIAENDSFAWDYGSDPLKEEQKPILVPKKYEFSCPLTKLQWDTLINNKKKSIQISSTDTNHFSVFIEKVSWKPSNGMADFNVLKAYV